MGWGDITKKVLSAVVPAMVILRQLRDLYGKGEISAVIIIWTVIMAAVCLVIVKGPDASRFKTGRFSSFFLDLALITMFLYGSLFSLPVDLKYILTTGAITAIAFLDAGVYFEEGERKKRLKRIGILLVAVLIVLSVIRQMI